MTSFILFAVPLGPSALFDSLNANGVFVTWSEHRAAANSESGRSSGDATLGLIDGQPGLIVDPRCVTIHKGFVSDYRYRRMQVTGTEKYDTAPEKNASRTRMTACSICSWAEARAGS